MTALRRRIVPGGPLALVLALSSVLVATLALAPAPTGPGASVVMAAAPVGPHRVVLVSIDGMAASYLARADELGLAIPNIRRLEREGTTAEAATSVLPSVTYPAHTTMISGVSPRRHGITANNFLDPLDPGQMRGEGAFVFYEDIKAPTLFDAVRAKGGTSGAVWWPVSAGGPMDWNFPDLNAETIYEARLLLQFSSPEVRTLAGSPEALIGAGEDTRLDELRTRIGVAFLRHRPRLLAVHLIALDTTSHVHGPYTPQALAALEMDDRLLGNLLAAIQDAGLAGDTVVALTSDHGFLPCDRQVSLGVLFAACGLLTADGQGKLASWAAYPWTDGGEAAIYLNPAAPAGTAARVDRVLELLRALPDYGVHRIYRGAEMERFGGHPGAYAVLDAEPGFVFASKVAGPVVSPSALLGTHGHAPDRPELLASLVLRGPGIRAGARIPRVRLLDVAPTLARILDVDLGGRGAARAPGASRTPSEGLEGRVLEEVFTHPGKTGV